MTELELIELKYFNAKGFKYIAKNENGKTQLFKRKPIREKIIHRYECWTLEGNPISRNNDEYVDVELGEYKFIKWENDPILINKLITKTNKTKKWTKEESIKEMKQLFNDNLKWTEDDIKLKISKKIFKENGLESMLHSLYNGSPYNAIKELYPNIQPWELKVVPRNYWNETTTIEAMKWLFNEKLKWNKTAVRDYTCKKVFVNNNLGSMINHIYKDNITKAVSDILPYITDK